MTLKIDPYEIRRICEAEQARRQKPAQATQPRQAAPAVSASYDFWRVENVLYSGAACTVDLAKALLDGGSSKTQDEWVSYSRQAKQNGGFYVGSMPLCHAVFAALSKSQNRDAEDARNFLKTQMRGKCLVTLTRIRYNPSGADEVLHNVGMDDQYVLKNIIVGPSEFISAIKDTSYLETILGTADVREINAVHQWMNEGDAYIWRLGKKPESTDERVAGFLANAIRSILICNWNPQYTCTSLGVRRVAPQAP